MDWVFVNILIAQACIVYEYLVEYVFYDGICTQYKQRSTVCYLLAEYNDGFSQFRWTKLFKFK